MKLYCDCVCSLCECQSKKAAKQANNSGGKPTMPVRCAHAPCQDQRTTPSPSCKLQSALGSSQFQWAHCLAQTINLDCLLHGSTQPSKPQQGKPSNMARPSQVMCYEIMCTCSDTCLVLWTSRPGPTLIAENKSWPSQTLPLDVMWCFTPKTALTSNPAQAAI